MEEEKKELSRAAKWQQAHKNDPEYIAKRKQQHKEDYERNKLDPVWLAKKHARDSKTGAARNKLYRERHPEKVAERHSDYYLKTKYGIIK